MISTVNPKQLGKKSCGLLHWQVSPLTPLADMVRLLEEPPGPWPQGWAHWDVTIKAHRQAAREFLLQAPPFPKKLFQGRGLVIVGGGERYFASVYVTVRALRHVGCRLPIQVWYLGRALEMPDQYQEILAPWGVACIDADQVRKQFPCRHLNGWELKPYALLHSPFEEVLLLDADCYPVRDPSFLFDVPSYRKTGAIFWPDYPNAPSLNWAAFGLDGNGTSSIESGQLVMHKRLCWKPLNLAWWYNDHSDWSYQHGYGDKHTFEVAWKQCRRSFVQFSDHSPWSVHSYLHQGPDGDTLFVHRCRDKFRLENHGYFTPQMREGNQFNPDLPLEDFCFGWLTELAHILGPAPGGRDSATSLTPTRTVQLDPEKLAPAQEHFNCSILNFRGKLLLAYRTGLAGSRLHICELERKTLQAVHAGQPLRPDHPRCGAGCEDPRLFVHQERLHCFFHGVENQGGKTTVHPMMALLGDNHEVAKAWCVDYQGRAEWEKNWAPFEHEGELFSVYSISPHVVLHHVGERAYPFARTEAKLPWTWGQLRGGAPPVRVGDEYYHFFHGALDTAGGRRVYSLGVYTFEARPPFRVTRMSPEPILLPGNENIPTPRRHMGGVVFPCGAVRRGAEWLIAHGYQDKFCRIAAFKTADVEKALAPLPGTPRQGEGFPAASLEVPVQPVPATWCITCPEIDREAKARAHFAEVGLPVRFFHGVHGQTFGLKTVIPYEEDGPLPSGFSISQGHVGLTLSHWCLWNILQHQPGDEFFILEDDAVFEADILKRFGEFRAALPADWQFVFVGHVGEIADKVVRQVNDKIAEVRFCFGTHACLVRRSALETLLQTNRYVWSHIDLQLARRSLPRLKTYAFIPSLVRQRSYAGEWARAVEDGAAPYPKNELEIALIVYENADKALTRWSRDILPALKGRPPLTCVDNSRQPSPELRGVFHDGYMWMGGANLRYGPSMNLIAQRSRANLLLYVCTNHGRMIDPRWIEDLLAPLAKPKVAMAGCITPSASPEQIGATEFIGSNLPLIHVQGGVFAAKVAALKSNPYPPEFPHLYTDHAVCWALMRNGWELADVPTIKSVWRQKIEDASMFKFVHDET